MIQIKYKTNAQKCIEENAKAYKRKPVFKRARQVKRMMQELDRQWKQMSDAAPTMTALLMHDIDFKMF